ERLRGFGAGVGRALTCNCALVRLADGAAAILVVATERAGPALPLDERARRLLDGCEEPVAVFSADGALLNATPAAHDKLEGATTLESLQAAGGERIESDGATVVLFDATEAPTFEAAIATPVATAPEQQTRPEPTPLPPAATPQPASHAAHLSERRHPLRF